MKFAVITVGCMQGSVHFRPLYHRKRHTYRNLSPETREALCQALGQPGRLPPGMLQRIHEETLIPKANLSRWRRLILQGTDPFAKRPGRGSVHRLTPEAEEEIYQRLLPYVDEERFCPPSVVRAVAMSVAGTTHPRFKAGRKWMKNFLRRHGLSLRSAHPRRQTCPNDGIIAAFLQEFEIAKLEIPHKWIYNMDETAWRLFNGRLRTVARRGQESVSTASHLSDKDCLTVICTVSLAGEKLPPWIIVKGKTDRCEDRYRNDPRLRSLLSGGHVFFTHSTKGWATKDVMKTYLTWLSTRIEPEWSYLVWDLHASHRDETVKAVAHESRVNLAYVPAGQTSVWQPMDVRVFGALKSHAQTLLNTECMNRPLEELDMVDAVLILLKAWTDLDRETIVSGWANIGASAYAPRHSEQTLDDQEEEEEEESSEDTP